MQVDDLLVHLRGEAVVDEQGNRYAQHEGEVAGEHVPDQHDDDGHGEQDVEQEELRTGQLADLAGLRLLRRLDDALGLRQPAVQARAAALLLPARQRRMRQRQRDAEDLDGQPALIDPSVRTHPGNCPEDTI